jgi:hypothetical protein
VTGILAFLLLLMLKPSGAREIHPTGEKPEPEPEPQPKPRPQPEYEIKIGPATIEPKVSPAHPAATKVHPAAAKVGPAPKSAAVPVAWPQAKPTGLPAWPSGWEPDTPVPKAETARATQLLPQLWKSGKPGTKVVEKTGDKWVTYLAFVPKKGRRGVAAYRVKPGATTPRTLEI